MTTGAGCEGLTPVRVSLSTPLSFRSSFLFPLQTAAARRDVLIGALWLLVPGVGWLLNMGHRILVVHRLLNLEEPWPAWGDYRQLLRHGGVAFAGMTLYYAPGAVLLSLAWNRTAALTGVAGLLLLIPATLAIPGYMTHYCVAFDPREALFPNRALRRALQAGSGYWKAWCIALSALGMSFLGVLALGLGFLITSVWFWQVAGFSFASAFSQHYRLGSTRPN
jgi:hypothetical protein